MNSIALLGGVNMYKIAILGIKPGEIKPVLQTQVSKVFRIF